MLQKLKICFIFFVIGWWLVCLCVLVCGVLPFFFPKISLLRYASVCFETFWAAHRLQHNTCFRSIQYSGYNTFLHLLMWRNESLADSIIAFVNLKVFLKRGGWKCEEMRAACQCWQWMIKNSFTLKNKKRWYRLLQCGVWHTNLICLRLTLLQQKINLSWLNILFIPQDVVCRDSHFGLLTAYE